MARICLSGGVAGPHAAAVRAGEGIQTGTPVSLVFIIDNSGSMDGNDSAKTRFSMVSRLLDSLVKVEPGCDAGLVVFTRRLEFDDRDGGIFASAFPGDTSQHDAFVPLTALNHSFANGHTGLDTLKVLLAYTDSGDLVHATRFPG